MKVIKMINEWNDISTAPKDGTQIIVTGCEGLGSEYSDMPLGEHLKDEIFIVQWLQRSKTYSENFDYYYSILLNIGTSSLTLSLLIAKLHLSEKRGK